MKRFVKTAAAFCLVLAAVLILADYPLSRSMRKVHTFGMDTWRDIFEGKAGADILIQGDSRAFNACDQAVFDSLTGLTAYNLATIGNPFHVQLFRYNLYREHSPAPKVILQFVDDFILGLTVGEYDRLQFLPWMWDISFFRGAFHFHSKLLRLQITFPFFRYHGTRPWELIRNPRQTLNGFYLSESEEARDTVFHREARRKWRFHYLEETDIIFRDFIKAALDEGIQVILVCPPFHDSFEFVDGDAERMVQYCSDVAEDCGIPFYNGFSMSIIHDSSMFRDRGHLNATGARVFSDSLARFVSELDLIKD